MDTKRLAGVISEIESRLADVPTVTVSAAGVEPGRLPDSSHAYVFASDTRYVSRNLWRHTLVVTLRYRLPSAIPRNGSAMWLETEARVIQALELSGDVLNVASVTRSLDASVATSRITLTYDQEA